MPTYLCGRLNLIAGTTKNKRDYVLDSLKNGATVTHDNYEWGFFDVAPVQVDGHELVSGFLAKFIPTVEEEIVDKNQHCLSMTKVDDRVIAKSSFFHHIDSGLIAFQAVSGKITANQFRKRFCQVFSRANEDMLCDAEIQIVTDEADILKRIHQFKSVRLIRIHLHPSNPSSRHIWQAIDDDMRNLSVDDYKQEFKSNKPGGMKVPADGDSTYKGILMANDGYGNAEIVGTSVEDRKLILSTEKIPVKTDIPPTDDRQSIAESVWEFFEKVLNRFR